MKLTPIGGLLTTQKLLVSLVVTVLLMVSGIATVQFTQWRAIDSSNGDGRATAQWEVFQMLLEHVKFKDALEKNLREPADKAGLHQLVLRYNIFLSRYELLSTGQNAALLHGRPSFEGLVARMNDFKAAAEDYLGDEGRTPPRDVARLTQIAAAFNAMEGAVRDVVQDSNEARAKINADNFQAARRQAVVAWVICALLMLVATGFGATAVRQMGLASRRSQALEELHREVSYRASHDSLTGLFNRDAFGRTLTSIVESDRENEAECALLYIDLDRFKVVNDTCGHVAGDELLCVLATLMAEPIRASDIVARIGGDEFAVLLKQCGMQQARQIAEQICRAVDQFRFLYGGYSFHVGASIGLVVIPPNSKNVSAIMQAADSACYMAKESGRNRVYVYREADALPEEVPMGNASWARRLANAVDEGRLRLYWQRVVPLHIWPSDGLSIEILVGLQENGEMILPSVFMPVAERYALASDIDRWTMTESLAWMATHRTLQPGIARLSVSLSSQSISDPAFQTFLLEQLRRSEFDMSKLCLEVKEASALTYLKGTISFFESVRELGVKVALSEFGNAMSSFAYLKTFPVDYLKIDNQFIRSLNDSNYDQISVRTLCDMAHATGKTTVVQGVEMESVWSDLKTMGVDFGLSHMLHQPEPLDQLASQLSVHLQMSQAAPTGGRSV